MSGSSMGLKASSLCKKQHWGKVGGCFRPCAGNCPVKHRYIILVVAQAQRQMTTKRSTSSSCTKGFGNVEAVSMGASQGTKHPSTVQQSTLGDKSKVAPQKQFHKLTGAQDGLPLSSSTSASSTASPAAPSTPCAASLPAMLESGALESADA